MGAISLEHNHLPMYSFEVTHMQVYVLDYLVSHIYWPFLHLSEM
jgi:hypothetical protein